MTDLTLHSRPVTTVFDLLGSTENDITYSFGWALANSEELTRSLVTSVTGKPAGELISVKLQEFETGCGITDIEILTEHAHLVIEAKRDWDPPSRWQLDQYARRQPQASAHAIVALAQASSAYAAPRVPIELRGVPISYRSWAQMATLTKKCADRKGAGHAEKRLLREFNRYLRGLMTMQDVDSNLVYVVSLNQDPMFGTDISFKDFVVKHGRYFHPPGGKGQRYPKAPPNYLGFRFDGRLQEIRHVESYTLDDQPWIDLWPKSSWAPSPHFHYRLGPPIKPDHTVKTGNLYASQRVEAALDLLLTCDTIRDARDATQARREAAGV